MPDQEEHLIANPLLLAFAPIHRRALGIASGVVLGGFLSLLTLVAVLRGGEAVNGLSLLSQFFWGYSVSWLGILTVFLWGFGLGFIAGWCMALFRNAMVWIWLTAIRSRAEMSAYSDFLDHL
jgi:hypothetical protein